MSAPTDQRADYREPGRSYGSLGWFGLLILVGIVLDAVFGGLRAHIVAWVIAAVLLLGVDLLVITAARTHKSLSLTADELRVGAQAVPRAAITRAVTERDPDLPVLGWPSGMPKGVDSIVLQTSDGGYVIVPTRHPDRLLGALGLGPAQAVAGAPRPADEDELPFLAEIEERAATVFRVAGIELPDLPCPDYAQVLAKAIFVLGTPPVGFARVDERDGAAHLEELAVLPGHMRRGVGTQLVEHVCDWARTQGYPAVTLCTFRDVAWNGPFYSRLGFQVVTEPGPDVAALREQERGLGLDDVGVRVVMRREL